MCESLPSDVVFVITRIAMAIGFFVLAGGIKNEKILKDKPT
jgi:hypothetical protein